ncbi:class E sortase [Cellulomonas sp. PhB143]|uniref:class E sortase n=1 Tax=Cellulomonas sp. PhB143 TaxID=2485186 RepID=UPI000F90C47A|nr:class E sortase [Cellulomonas sp. PhB143]ROS75569.1 sortase A [Cellulomonas sp. PhB143]
MTAQGTRSSPPGSVPHRGAPRMVPHANPTHGRPGRRGGVGSHVVGVVGELLITLGVLLALFIVWQLWWTDVQGDRYQADVIDSLAWTPPPAQADADPTPRRDEPPVMDEPANLTVFAQMYVPRFGADYVKPVAQGIDKAEVLDTIGIGHYPGTAMPGGLGNFAVAAHRTTFGKPFNKIADLREGDPVVVRTEDTWYVYRVTTHLIVYPDEVGVVAPVPSDPDDPDVVPTQRLITMTSCHPLFSAAQRYIVHGELDYWLPVEDGTPAELTDAGIDPSSAGGP